MTCFLLGKLSLRAPHGSVHLPAVGDIAATSPSALTAGRRTVPTLVSLSAGPSLSQRPGSGGPGRPLTRRPDARRPGSGGGRPSGTVGDRRAPSDPRPEPASSGTRASPRTRQVPPGSPGRPCARGTRDKRKDTWEKGREKDRKRKVQGVSRAPPEFQGDRGHDHPTPLTSPALTPLCPLTCALSPATQSASQPLARLSLLSAL